MAAIFRAMSQHNFGKGPSKEYHKYPSVVQSDLVVLEKKINISKQMTIPSDGKTHFNLLKEKAMVLTS